jgi:hypothetical protein
MWAARTDVEELTKNVMVCLAESFTRLRADDGSGSKAKAGASLNLKNLVQRREVGSVERAVRLLARLVALANASAHTRLIEIIAVDSDGLRLVVDVMWHLGLAGDDAALCLVCLQIVAGLVAYETPPAHLLPRAWLGQGAASQGSGADDTTRAARAQEQLAANRLWQSHLCKAALLFGTNEPGISEHVLRAFPIKRTSQHSVWCYLRMRLSVLNTTVCSRVAVGERLGPIGHQQPGPLR